MSLMPKKEKYKHLPNPERVKAENERRRSSAASPQESRDKRLRTDERVIAHELRLDHGQVCPKCGSPTCLGDRPEDTMEER